MELIKSEKSGLKFARDLLTKYGWEEGKGLGKNEDGITKPVKASMKMNKTGVGYNPGQEFSCHWWDDVFNSAAKSIVVENSQNGVEVTTKKIKKKPKHGTFIKMAVLNNANDEHNQIDDVNNIEDEGINLSSRLSDEEIFKACGGRTAHKAARHGHKLNGKLRRLEEQERMHLEQQVHTPEPLKTDKSTKLAEEIKNLKHHKSRSKKRSRNEILTEASESKTTSKKHKAV